MSARVDDFRAAPAAAAAFSATAPGPAPATHVGRAALASRRLTIADATAAAAALLVVAEPVTAAGDGHLSMLLAAVVFVAAAVCGSRAAGLHRTGTQISRSTIDDIPRLIAVAAGASWLYVLTLQLLSLPPLSAAKMLTFSATTLLFFVLARALARTILRHDAAFVQPTLIVGAGAVGQLVARKLQHHPEYGLRLEGLVDDRPRERRADLDQMTVLGGIDDLPALVESHGIQRVVVAFSKTPEQRVLELLRVLASRGVEVDVVPRLFQAATQTATFDAVEGLPLMSLQPQTRSRAYIRAKRALDVVGALIGLVVAAPLMLFIAWRIKRDSPGPILFRQQRCGMHLREFTNLKFRTMRDGTSSDEHREYIRATSGENPTRPEDGLFKLERRDAVTNIGRWLRRTSLDELPQLINVLRGEMSLVGPRPCIPYELEHFAPHHFERFSVPQGLTGAWQVTARAHATFAEALDIDVAYAQSCSFWLDLKLILLTPLQLLGLGGTR